MLSKLQLYGLFETSGKAYLIIFVGILSFNLGYCALNKKIKIKSSTVKLGMSTYEINYKLILILCCLELLFRLKDLSVTIPGILSGQSLEILRRMAQDTGSDLYTTRSGIESAMRTLFVYPFMNALIPITAVDFWMGKRNKALLFSTVGLSIISVLCSGGRSNILMLAVSFTVVYFFSGKYLKHYVALKGIWKRKRRIIFISASILGATILLLATFSRSGQNTIRFLYYYYAMPPYMLSEWGNTVEQQGIYGYGLSSFCGYTFSILYLLKNLFRLSSYPEFFYNIVLATSATDQEWVTISSLGSPANAYVSIFWFPYYDGRFIGLIILMFLLGLFIKQIYLRACDFSDSRMIAIYVLLFYGIFMSYVRFQFAQTAQALAFIYILFLIKRKKIYLYSINKEN